MPGYGFTIIVTILLLSGIARAETDIKISALTWASDNTALLLITTSGKSQIASLHIYDDVTCGQITTIPCETFSSIVPGSNSEYLVLQDFVEFLAIKNNIASSLNSAFVMPSGIFHETGLSSLRVYPEHSCVLASTYMGRGLRLAKDFISVTYSEFDVTYDYNKQILKSRAIEASRGVARNTDYSPSFGNELNYFVAYRRLCQPQSFSVGKFHPLSFLHDHSGHFILLDYCTKDNALFALVHSSSALRILKFDILASEHVEVSEINTNLGFTYEFAYKFSSNHLFRLSVESQEVHISDWDGLELMSFTSISNELSLSPDGKLGVIWSEGGELDVIRLDQHVVRDRFRINSDISIIPESVK